MVEMFNKGFYPPPGPLEILALSLGLLFGLLQSLTGTFIDGFQCNLAGLFSIMCRCAVSIQGQGDTSRSNVELGVN